MWGRRESTYPHPASPPPPRGVRIPTFYAWDRVDLGVSTAVCGVEGLHPLISYIPMRMVWR